MIEVITYKSSDEVEGSQAPKQCDGPSFNDLIILKETRELCIRGSSKNILIIHLVIIRSVLNNGLE
jgi:hypothetical protein